MTVCGCCQAACHPRYLQMHGLHALIAITRVHRALAHMMLTHEKCALQAPDVPLDVLGAESEGQIGYPPGDSPC